MTTEELIRALDQTIDDVLRETRGMPNDARNARMKAAVSTVIPPQEADDVRKR